MSTNLHHKAVLTSLRSLRSVVQKIRPLNELHTICLGEVIHSIDRSIQFIEDLETYNPTHDDPFD